MDFEQQFRDALAARGIEPPETIIGDGRLHRCDAVGRNGKGDAAYLIHLDARPAGGFENHRDGGGWQSWRADVKAAPKIDRAALRAKMAADAKRRERDAKTRFDIGCGYAKARWAKCSIESRLSQHPYLFRKKVFAFGLRRDGSQLVVPVRAGQRLTSLQFIYDDGRKRFLNGATVASGYHSIGTIKNRILIAEGYATGATAHMATGDAVAVAFDCGNLLPVARRLRDAYPYAELVLCADDDENGVGEVKATEAAMVVGGKVLLPRWFGRRPDGATDFNDMAEQYGLESVAEVLR